MPDRVSANTGHLQQFVEHGKTYRTELADIEQLVRHARIQAAAALGHEGNVPHIESMLSGLIEEADGNTSFVSNIHDALLQSGTTQANITSASAGDIDSAIRARSFDVELITLSEAATRRELVARDNVIAAMQAGLTPEQAGLPEDDFPFSYRSMHRIENQIEGLKLENEDIDGSSWAWWDGDRPRMNQIKKDITRKTEDSNYISTRIGADDKGRLTEIEAIALLGEWTGDREWEGTKYGSWTNKHMNENKTELDDGSVNLTKAAAGKLGDEFELIGNEIAIEPETALGFYNELGVEGTAYLPTVLVDSIPAQDNRKFFDTNFANYGTALGHASRQRTNSGRSALAFGGGELLRQPLPHRPETKQPDYAVYHPAFLFGTGEFDNQFLIDATAEALIQAETNPNGTDTIQSAEGFSDKTGEDPRNILLDRTAENVETAAGVVDKLWRSHQRLNDVLLSPENPFVATYTHNDVHHLHLSTDMPITDFLIKAALDDRASNRILRSAGTNPKQLSDAGVAAGVDGVMATHVTLMYPKDALTAVGIDHPTINDLKPIQTGPTREPKNEREIKITAAIWKITRAKVLDHGKGTLTASQTESLLDQAIGGAINNGEFNADLTDPFATIAGAVRTETIDGELSYNEKLDDKARSYNRNVNTVAAGSFAATGLVSTPVSFAAGMAGTGITAFDPLSKTTDNERNALRNELTQSLFVTSDGTTRWSNIIYNKMLADATATGKTDLVIPGTNKPQPVPTRSIKKGEHQWWNPTDETWNNMPTLGDDHAAIFTTSTPIKAAIGQAVDLKQDYMDGAIFAAGIDDDVIARRLAQHTDDTPEKTRVRVNTATEMAKKIGLDEWTVDGKQRDETPDDEAS